MIERLKDYKIKRLKDYKLQNYNPDKSGEKLIPLYSGDIYCLKVVIKLNN